MGQAIYWRPRTSQAGKGQKIYLYLLRNREVKEPDEVWCTDITYIRMAKGYAYPSRDDRLKKPGGAFVDALQHA